jgi:peroxiredoxin
VPRATSRANENEEGVMAIDQKKLRAVSWLVVGLSVGCDPARAPARSAGAVEPSAFDVAAAEPSITVTPQMGSPHVGDTAPDFELSDQTGAKVKLSSLRGKVVMLAFVTSWCPFSEAEQPNLAKLATDYAADERVKVLAVDIKEGDDGYAKYLGRAKAPFPVLHDASGAVTTTFTPPLAQPSIKDRATVLVTSNMVLDPEGKIRFFTMVDTVHFDARLVHARAAIEGLLAQAPR